MSLNVSQSSVEPEMLLNSPNETWKVEVVLNKSTCFLGCCGSADLAT